MAHHLAAAAIATFTASTVSLVAQAVDSVGSDTWTQVVSSGGAAASVAGLLWVLRQVMSGGLVVRSVSEHDRLAREQLERAVAALEAAGRREEELHQIVRELGAWKR